MEAQITNENGATIKDLRTAEIEEAIQETPSEQMDRILHVHEQWETVNLLIKLLNRELGLNDDAKPQEVRYAMKELQDRYHKNMMEWREMRTNTANTEKK